MTRSRSLFALPILGLIVLVAVVVIAGGREDDAPTQFERLVAHPDRYAGKVVRVTGRVRSPGREPASAPRAFVLEGDAGRVLVLPPVSGKLPVVSDGLRVAVHGRVIALPPSADDLRGDQPGDPVVIADVVARSDADALLRADSVAVRGS
jgi:hypothetical protein